MHRLAAVLAATGLVTACSTKPRRDGDKASQSAAKSAEDPASASAAPGTDPAASTDELDGLPPAVESVAIDGVLEPAPWLAQARRVAALSVGETVLVAAGGEGWLRLYTRAGKVVREIPREGVVQLLVVLDVDGDGQDELLVGAGRSREQMAAPATLAVVRPRGRDEPEVIPLPGSSRAEVVGAVPASEQAGDLWVAAYAGRYEVAVHRARRGDDGWTLDEVGRTGVSGAVAALPGSDGQMQLVVSTMYGANPDEPGGIAIGLGESAVEIPSIRGARTVVALGGQGATGAIAFTDGWHKEYGKKARGLVSLAEPTANGWQSRVLTHVKGRFGFETMRAGDWDGDGRPDLFAAGFGPAVAVATSGDAQPRHLGTSAAHDVYPFDFDDDGRDEVIVLGDEPGIWVRR